MALSTIRPGTSSATAIGTMAVLAVIYCGTALSVTPLTTRELASHCIHYPANPLGPDAIFCVRYIQGFIDGAVATDERVMVNVAAEYSRTESFSERALRTRGGQRLEKYGPTVYAEFCLGDPVALKTVVEQVVRDLEEGIISEQNPLARAAVYQTLRTTFSCAEEADE
ncbi:MAG: hypothetical protein IMF06_04245 [Proteobacteria bacterium]|nr:hypothetical protein [Pseudomonadota bacterium]